MTTDAPIAPDTDLTLTDVDLPWLNRRLDNIAYTEAHQDAFGIELADWRTGDNLDGAAAVMLLRFADTAEVTLCTGCFEPLTEDEDGEPIDAAGDPARRDCCHVVKCATCAHEDGCCETGRAWEREDAVGA